MIAHLPHLKEMLQGRGPVQNIQTPFGILDPPLGSLRLKAVEMVLVLVMVDDTSIRQGKPALPVCHSFILSSWLWRGLKLTLKAPANNSTFVCFYDKQYAIFFNLWMHESGQAVCVASPTNVLVQSEKSCSYCMTHKHMNANQLISLWQVLPVVYLSF